MPPSIEVALLLSVCGVVQPMYIISTVRNDKL